MIDFIHIKVTRNEFLAFLDWMATPMMDTLDNLNTRHSTALTEHVLLYDFCRVNINAYVYQKWMERPGLKRYNYKFRAGYALLIYELLKKEDLSRNHDLRFFAGNLQHQLQAVFAPTRLSPIKIEN